MSRRRRALLLGLLTLLLGGLAASDVSRREAALRRRLGPTVPVVVARRQLDAGSRLQAGGLGVRRVPARYAPSGAFARVDELVGLRTAVAVPAGADLVGAMVDDGTSSGTGAPVRSGERIADVVAAGSPDLVRPGARVDVVVTRGEATGGGRSQLALEDVKVLAASPAPGVREDDGEPRVAAALRVTLRQAVFLAAAQSFAREIRLLPRAAADQRRGDLGMSVDSSLVR